MRFVTLLQEDPQQSGSYVVCLVVVHVEGIRNNSLHNNSHETQLEIFNAIVSLTYHWVHHRERKDNLNWDEWNESPFNLV